MFKPLAVISFLLLISCRNSKDVPGNKNEVSIKIDHYSDTSRILFMFYKIRYKEAVKRSEISFVKYILSNGRMKADLSAADLQNNYILIKMLREDGSSEEKRIIHPLYLRSEVSENGKFHGHVSYLDSGSLIFRINCDKGISGIELSENFKNRDNKIGIIKL
jgi:hypothetical protein